MKRVLISATMLIGMMASVVVFSSFTTPKENTEMTCIVVSPEPSCKTAGNCSVNLCMPRENEYYVQAVNYNDYKVTIYWTAVGYDKNGNKRNVGSGTLTCEPNNRNRPAISSRFRTSTEDVGLATINVLKCD